MRKIIGVALVVLLTAACQQKEEPKPQFELPTAPVQTQDDTKLLQEAVKKDPGNINAWIKLGNTLMDTSNFNEAIDAYQKALDIDPKNVNVRVDMGTCYRNTGRPDIAVKEFRKAIEIDKNHAYAHKNLAVVLAYDLKDNAQAVKEFERYLQLEPNSPDADKVREEIKKFKGGK